MKEHDKATMVGVVRLINDYEALGFNTARCQQVARRTLALMGGEMKTQIMLINQRMIYIVQYT